MVMMMMMLFVCRNIGYRQLASFRTKWAKLQRAADIPYATVSCPIFAILHLSCAYIFRQQYMHYSQRAHARTDAHSACIMPNKYAVPQHKNAVRTAHTLAFSLPPHVEGTMPSFKMQRKNSLNK